MSSGLLPPRWSLRWVLTPAVWCPNASGWPERCPAYRGVMTAGGAWHGDADVAKVAALMGEAARASVLVALAGGRALTASTLAAEAGVAPSTISGHLARLVDGGLVSVEVSGRHRYYRLAGPEVAHAVEALACLAPFPPGPLVAPSQPCRGDPPSPHLLRPSRRASRCRRARRAHRLGDPACGAGPGRTDRPGPRCGSSPPLRAHRGGSDRPRASRGAPRGHGSPSAHPLLRGLVRAAPTSWRLARRRPARPSRCPWLGCPC